MGIFGWSLPPGCGSLPWDSDYPCEICGVESDSCECPECPVCGDVGNLDCYTKYGHMVLTQEQKDMIEENKRKMEENARMEAECDTQYLQYLKDQKDLFSE